MFRVAVPELRQLHRPPAGSNWHQGALRRYGSQQAAAAHVSFLDYASLYGFDEAVGSESPVPSPDGQRQNQRRSKAPPKLLLGRWLKTRYQCQNSSRARRNLSIAVSLSDATLPVMLHQYMIREDARPGDRPLPDVMNGTTWQSRLDALAERGISEKYIGYLAWTLRPETADERIQRFVDDGKKKPSFMLLLLLREDSSFTQQKSLASLIRYITKTYCGPGAPAARERGEECQESDEATAFFNPTSEMTAQRFCRIIERLYYHCRRLWPESVVDLARLAVNYIERIGCSEDPEWKVLRRQTRVLNVAIQICSGLSHNRPLYYASYNWEAQKALLGLSSLEPRLIVERKSYEAVRTVLAGLRKTEGERRVAERLSPSWPPYPIARDGIDEQQNPEDTWSRAVRAGAMMQAVGYGKQESDEILDLIGGRDLEGRPTIQTRAALRSLKSADSMVNRNCSIWATRIRCTRNAHEAWEMFKRTTTAGAATHAIVYSEMFRKLAASEVVADQDALPGDVREGLPTEIRSITPLERLRTTPPSIEALYKSMMDKGIRPEGACLAELIRSARAHRDIVQYLQDSNISRQAWEPMVNWKEVHVDGVPPSVFEAYIRYLCQKHPNRAGDATKRVSTRRLGLIRRAIDLTQARLKSLTVEDAASRRSATAILDALARPNVMLSNDAPHQDAVLALETFLDVLRLAERKCGVDGDMFLALARVVQKLASFRLAGWPLADDLGEEIAAKLKGTFWGLVSPWADGRDGRPPQAPLLMGAPEANAADGLASSRTPAPHLIHAHLRALAFLGDHEEMARVLGAILDERNREAAELMMRAAGERQHHVHMSRALCVFRAVAEPKLAAEVVDGLRRRLEELKAMSGAAWWQWPEEEDVMAYVEGDRVGWVGMLRERVLGEVEAEALAARAKRKGSRKAELMAFQSPGVRQAPGSRSRPSVSVESPVTKSRSSCWIWPSEEPTAEAGAVSGRAYLGINPV